MASTFWVREVLDGATMVVEPSWTLGGRQGALIRATGLRVPALDDPHWGLAKTQMTLLVLGATIQITRVYGVKSEILECDISCQGRDLRKHFPRYAVPSAATPAK